jgi:hypothetical protein
MPGADRDVLAAGASPVRGPMRYEKAETVVRVALDREASGLGLSLEEILHNSSDTPLSLRPVERRRDAIERLFPQLEQRHPGEVPNHCGERAGTGNSYANITTAMPIRGRPFRRLVGRRSAIKRVHDGRSSRPGSG